MRDCGEEAQRDGRRKTMEELLKILSGICPKVDFVNEKKLIDNGVLDSFDIISIVNELNEHYDIEIDVDDLVDWVETTLKKEFCICSGVHAGIWLRAQCSVP